MAHTDRLTAEELLSHVDWMRRLARALVHDAAEAEDVTQEGLAAALARPPRADQPVRPWLAAVLRNLARLRARSRGRSRARETAAWEASPTAASSPEALAERVETERLVTGMVLALEEPFRATLLLRYYEGLSAADIARRLGVPAGTVRWRLKEGLDRVRAQLDKAHGGNRQRWRAILATGLIAVPAAPLAGAFGKVAIVVVGLALVVSATWLVKLVARPETTDQIGIPVTTARLQGGRGGFRWVAGPTAEPTGELRLSGRFVGPDEVAIPNAVIAIDSVPPRMVRTDADGAFAFVDLRARPYRLEASSGALYAGPIVTRPGPEPVLLRARSATRLEVEVRTRTGGTPVPGARVELRSTLVWQGTTDAEGRAVLSGVGAGWRPLRVEAPGFAPSVQMLVTGVKSTEQRVRVQLDAGIAVSGRVVGPDERPVPHARVWARSATEPFKVVDPALDAVTTDAEGRWRIAALPIGSHQLLASHPDMAQAATPPMVVGPGPLDGVVIRMSAGGRIVGEVVHADGKKAAGAQVRAAALIGTMPVEWQESREAFTDREGRFVVTGLQRQVVRVLALGDEASSEMTTADLGAQPEARVRLVLATRGVIAGTVVDGSGRPVAEAQVIARPGTELPPGKPNPWEIRGAPMMVSGVDGRFRFAGLPDGAYGLRASAPGADPAVVELQPLTKAMVNTEGVLVTVHGDGAIKGRVVFETGGAPAEFSLKVGKPAREAGSFVGTEGVFTVQVPAGTHPLAVYGPSFLTRLVEPVRVEEGRTVDVGQITVTRGRFVRGRVVSTDGAPVAGAQVVAGRLLTGSGSKLYIPTESIDSRETVSGADGRFTLPGFDHRWLAVTAERDGVGRAPTRTVPANTGDAEVELVLQPVGSLEGRITRDGRPFPDTAVLASSGLGLSFSFVTSGPDGHFAMDALTAGKHLVGGFLSKAKDMFMQPVQIEPGKRAQVHLDVRTGPIALTVRVTGGAPDLRSRVGIVSGRVSLGPSDTWEDVPRRLSGVITGPTTLHQRPTDSAGVATLDGLTPGEYTVCAGQSGKPGEPTPVRCRTETVTSSREVVVELGGK